ncbi:TetR family transcriptional regulator C-terminal domain-containing protein [Streptomyces sp. NPDC058960]|uniref:LmrA/YxaF family transcription factor n=1 Tax=Streptomyces sp. NPDC058960 TaxID=3346679 RepID=UPI0036B73C86
MITTGGPAEPCRKSPPRSGRPAGLATEAVRFTGEWTARSLRKEPAAGPVAGLRAFLALWRRIVVDSDFRAGCPVLAVSIEEPSSDETPTALAAAADVFTRWESLLADSLREHGAEHDQAAQLATLIVAAVEGTVAMCRAKRSTQPLDHTAEQLQALVLATVKD